MNCNRGHWQLLLIPLFSLLFFRPINLTTADLGRHIKNGQVFFEQNHIVKTNFYSYTQPELPTTNHHWGAGIIFYLIYKALGFLGLHSIFALLGGLTLYLVYLTLKSRSTPWFALAGVLLIIPLVRLRLEVRPEMISYFFIALYIYLYEKHKNSEISLRFLLLVLLPVQLVWVNIHIFFVLGIFISLVYLKNWKGMLFIAVSLLNPFGVMGLIEPFNIFREYGYTIVENKSVFFMQNRLPRFEYLYFELLFIVFLITAYYLLVEKRDFSYRELLFISFVFGVLAFVMNRNIILFAIVFTSLLSVYKSYVSKRWLQAMVIGLVSILIINIRVFWGVGLLPNIFDSAKFFKTNDITGPVFNNYDIGGYLIFNDVSVFVDNRPEAYSVDFLKNVYIKAQEDEDSWIVLDREYDFNVIYFYRHDATPWAQPFLIKRIQDEEWAPIYVDDYVLILVKNREQNFELIKNFALPQEYFKIAS